jgi:DNA-directed RNA polymerase specialized sigma24 family protein
VTSACPSDEGHLREAEDRDAEAAQARERLERRLADEELMGLLEKHDFTGPLWEEGLAPELARYGMSVLRAWITTGVIFKRCSDHQLRLAPWAERPSPEDVADLASMTAARALATMRERARAGKGWRADGGASLASWFVGGCLYAFANVWREWLVQQRRVRDGDLCARSMEQTREPSPDPAAAIGLHDHAAEILRGTEEPMRTALAYKALGLSTKEIAEITGLDARALEGRLYRLGVGWRKRG